MSRWVALVVLIALLVLLTPRAVRAAVLYKRGVDLSLQPEMARALPLIETAHLDAGVARGAVITSARDGVHSAGSLHGEGYAVDLRTNDLTGALVERLAVQLRARLNGAGTTNRPYQVVTEADHIHVEYQPYDGWRPA